MVDALALFAGVFAGHAGSLHLERMFCKSQWHGARAARAIECVSVSGAAASGHDGGEEEKNRFGRFVDNLQSADVDDALGDVLHGGVVALGASKEYLVDPFMGIGSGATSRERKEILDAVIT